MLLIAVRRSLLVDGGRHSKLVLIRDVSHHTPSDDPFESRHELCGRRHRSTRVVPTRWQ
jgi:hypothetical protein